jgi:hypothetical protein
LPPPAKAVCEYITPENVLHLQKLVGSLSFSTIWALKTENLCARFMLHATECILNKMFLPGLPSDAFRRKTHRRNLRGGRGGPVPPLFEGWGTVSHFLEVEKFGQTNL